MLFTDARSLRSVGKLGAPAGAVLVGAGQNNQGLRIRALEAQAKGNDGPVRGPFVLLDAGDNRHSDALTPLVNRQTDAQEVLALLREKHPACVNVVNAGTLVMEVPRPVKASDPDPYHPEPAARQDRPTARPAPDPEL